MGKLVNPTSLSLVAKACEFESHCGYLDTISKTKLIQSVYEVFESLCPDIYIKTGYRLMVGRRKQKIVSSENN